MPFLGSLNYQIKDKSCKIYSLLKVILSFGGLTNSNVSVFANPPPSVNGALKPLECAFFASNCVVAQSFFGRTEFIQKFYKSLVKLL